MRHIFAAGELIPFTKHVQLQHAVRAQSGENLWILSQTPIFKYMAGVSQFRGFISRVYSMILSIFLEGFPLAASNRWERDVGVFEDEQWEEALQGVKLWPKGSHNSTLYLEYFIRPLGCTKWG